MEKWSGFFLKSISKGVLVIVVVLSIAIPLANAQGERVSDTAVSDPVNDGGDYVDTVSPSSTTSTSSTMMTATTTMTTAASPAIAETTSTKTTTTATTTTTTASPPPPPTTTTATTMSTTMRATTAVPTTTTTEVPRTALMYNPVFQKVLQNAFNIVYDELKDITIPVTAQTPQEVMAAALQNIDITHIAKRLITQTDIRFLLPKPHDVRQRCYDEVMDLIDGVIGQRKDASSTDFFTTPWAAQVLDAMGKPDAGLLRGTLQWVGDYDQCLDIRVTVPDGAFLGSRATARNGSSHFYTQYCRVQILLPSFAPGSEHNRTLGFWKRLMGRRPYLHWGVCVPRSCSERDVVSLLSPGTPSKPGALLVDNAVCFDTDRDVGTDAGAIVTICILSVTAAIVVACTVLETALYCGYLPLASGQEESRDKNAQRNKACADVQPTPHSGHEANGSMKSGSRSLPADPRTPLTSNNRRKDVIRDGSATSDTPGPQAEEKDRKHGPSMGLLLLQTFSARHNGQRLLAVSSPSDSNTGTTLTSLHGLRVISMTWIVLGHTYTLGGSWDKNNFTMTALKSIQDTVSKFGFTFVTGANLAVDTFFVISGLLAMMLTLKELRKGKGDNRGFWIVFFVHRIWRLTPIYMMVLMTGTNLYEYVVEGPIKSDPYAMFEHCSSNWWANLLYINNAFKQDEMCMPWTWYLAVDFQLFQISPLFIILVYRKFRIGVWSIIATIVVGTLSLFFVDLRYSGQMLTMFVEDPDYWKYVYVAPWTRLADFSLGMLLGVVMLEEVKVAATLSRVKTLAIWVVLTGLAFFCVTINHDQWKGEGHLWPRGTQALYESGSRLVWSIYIVWVIFACERGLGGFVTSFLRWPPLQPFARLSYTVYLVHPLVLTFFVSERNSTIDLQTSVMIYTFLGNLIMSYLVAVVFTLMFESPLMGLEKIIFRRK